MLKTITNRLEEREDNSSSTTLSSGRGVTLPAKEKAEMPWTYAYIQQ